MLNSLALNDEVADVLCYIEIIDMEGARKRIPKKTQSVSWRRLELCLEAAQAYEALVEGRNQYSAL